MLGDGAYYVASVIILVTMIYGYQKLSDTKAKNWKYCILIPFFAVIMTIENHYNLYALQTITSLIFYFVLDYNIFKRSIKRTLYYVIGLWLLGMIIDLGTMYRSNLIGEMINEFDNTLIRAIDSVIMAMVVIVIIQIPQFKKILQKFFNKINKNDFPYFQIILLVLVELSLSYTIYHVMINSEKGILINWLTILMVSVILLICVYVVREYENYSLKETNDNLIKSNEFYIKIVEEYEIYKHNINHKLNGVKSVANKEAVKLIEDIMENEKKEKKYYNYKMKNLPIGIARIIYEKIFECKEPKLNLGVDNLIETKVFEELSPRNYNLLCESIGILMENALEAAIKTKDKIIMIDMRENEKSYQITIINTFTEVLDIEKIGSKKYTTKKTGHGIGLFSIGKKKIKVKTSIINDLFVNEIIVLKKSN